ncbi:MAG TPA: UDP-glucose 4-epimerase GalE [Lentisphaeria bacterium]|nr:MAG: UDP-glucose 4-epimerase GalE [Lentisphaerae bacterium GWF2_38_69]HBM16399.1 UDP-glucose 4-epimerase GalE [Lentisphaeria bacterium]
MNVLVTGGAGYIGSATVEYLLNHEHKVSIVDSLATGHREAVDRRADFIEMDLSERDRLIHFVMKGSFEAIIHFAAYSLVGESMQNPSKYFINNDACSINLLDAAVAGKIKSFVFSSTAATYGLPEESPIKETTPQLPINPYGESKLFLEKMLYWYNQIHGMKYTALRYFNAAGASTNFGEDHSPETHLVPIVLQAAMGQRKNVAIFGDDYNTKDGTCIRDYIHIEDLAQAHMLALTAPRSGHYNLGTGSGFSVKEVIEVAREVTGKKIEVSVSTRRSGDPAILIADSTLARKELNWNPLHENIREIINSAWEWKKKFPTGYNDK